MNLHIFRVKIHKAGQGTVIKERKIIFGNHRLKNFQSSPMTGPYSGAHLTATVH